MIAEDESGWTLEDTVADFYLKDFRASMIKEMTEETNKEVKA